MAHFAKIEDGNVTDIIVVANPVLDDGSETENEQQGKDLIAEIGKDGTWVQTSYNGNFRKQFAVIGGTYNSEKDIFIRKLHEQCIILKNKNVALEERIEWMEDELRETRGYTLHLYFENGDSEEHRYHIWERKKMISKLNYYN